MVAKKKTTKKSVTKKKVTKKVTKKKAPGKKQMGIVAKVKAARAKKNSKRIADQSNWRKKIDPSMIQFIDASKEAFCMEFAKCGRMKQSAEKVGVSYECVRSHLSIDPEFAMLLEEAKEMYKDVVHKVVQKVALEGVLKPIIGGKNKDRVVAHERVYATNILSMEMKRTNPAYREKSEVDVTVKGGVLLIPSDMTQEEWITKNAKPVPKDVGKVIEHGGTV